MMVRTPATRIRFGAFDLDVESETLLQDGRRVRIQPQPLRVLTFLVERAGTVVSREDLGHAIWDSATFVEFDQGLNYCIRQIRHALGDDAATPMYVETVKKRGYIFIAPVEVVPAQSNAVSAAETPIVPPTVRRPHWWPLSAGALMIAIAALIGTTVFVRQAPRAATYRQITNFNSAAFSPAISPDGRMIAFIVGSDVGFPFTGEIYTKLLPDGEPVQRTRDSWPKYGVAFSADGSQITYTVSDPSHGWSTASLPVLGGDPRLFLPNAAGLTWLDGEHALFAEIKVGLHMGLVTATTSRSNVKDIYLPKHERGMAHYGYASPDRSHVLVVEMGPTGEWEQCRLVPINGSSAGSQVGPAGSCTSAAWSADGVWMYFTARVDGASHVWRQRYPAGALEQITSGPLEEVGVIVTADGRSVLTSAGILESGAWMHDAGGDHLISPEGYAASLSFSRDSRHIYYLLRRERGAPIELWTTDITTRKSAALLTGFAIDSYDISPDADQVVFAARNGAGVSQLWLASCDGQFPPRLIAKSGGSRPAFGPDGDIVFQMTDGAKNYLVDMKIDGSQRRKIMEAPIIDFKGVSPDRRLLVASMSIPSAGVTSAVFAIALRDGSAAQICPAECMAKWSPDGTRFYVEPFLQGSDSGKAVVMSVLKGESIPHLPASGVRSAADATLFHGSTVADFSAYDQGHAGAFVTPGPSQETFAFTRTISHRNLFQVVLP